jgi:fatty acyl-CoA reductase
VLVEKLLFECPDIEKIYILLRPKRGQQSKQRLEEFIRCKYFKTCDRIKSEILSSKLEAIDGDITKPELGLSPDDRQKLIANVSVVFHSAASVKFNDPLK